MKIVTFNLRMENRHDGVNYFYNRAPYILAKIKSEKPDVICFQEATVSILAWVKAVLCDYETVGTGRGADLRDEANPISFRRDSFTLFGLSQFWLSPTPSVPGSRYEDQSDCPRICTAAELRHTDTDRIIRVYNTHLDHIGAGARMLGINQVLGRIKSDNDARRLPVVLTGDMNAEPDEVSMKAVRGFEPYPLTDVTADIGVTFHDFGRENHSKIDYIFTDAGTRFGGVTAWDDKHGDIYLTDHYPISAEIDI